MMCLAPQRHQLKVPQNCRRSLRNALSSTIFLASNFHEIFEQSDNSEETLIQTLRPHHQSRALQRLEKIVAEFVTIPRETPLMCLSENICHLLEAFL